MIPYSSHLVDYFNNKINEAFEMATAIHYDHHVETFLDYVMDNNLYDTEYDKFIGYYFCHVI